MATFGRWPFEFHGNFETGDATQFDDGIQTVNAESSTIAHYTEAARFGISPYDGAYCLLTRFNASGSVGSGFVRDETMSIGDGTTDQLRFTFCVGEDVSFPTGDTVIIFAIRASTGGNLIGIVYLDFPSDGGNPTIKLESDSLTGGTAFETIERGSWYEVVLEAAVNTASNGSLSAWVAKEGKGFRSGTNVTAGSASATFSDAATMDEVAASFELGPQNVAADAVGTWAFGSLYKSAGTNPLPMSDAPFDTTAWMGKTGHLFVGPGYVCDATLQGGASQPDPADNVLELWDTDRGDTSDPSKMKARLACTASNETINLAEEKIKFWDGCYAVLTPYNPDSGDPQATFVYHPSHHTRATRLRWARQGAKPL